MTPPGLATTTSARRMGAAPVASDEGPSQRNWRHVARAAWRRLAYPVIAAEIERRATLAERALGFLELAAVNGGVCEPWPGGLPSPEATRSVAEVASQLGAHELADRCRRWLAAHADAPEGVERLEPGQPPPARGGQGPDQEPDQCAGAIAAGSAWRLAELAERFFRQGDRQRGGRALALLLGQQADHGGFPSGEMNARRCRWAWRSKWLGGGAGPWSPALTARVLRLAEQEIAAGFHEQGSSLPSEFAETDGRWLAVSQLAQQLPSGARVVDAGCGSGRLLRRLARARPDLDLVGVEPDPRLLAQLPADSRGLRGGLEDLPLADASCDLAVAIESLEHSLWPRRGVAELCRVVRPGGWIVVIDKRRARQPLSDFEPWEQWFRPQQVAEWMSPWVHSAECHGVAHGSQQRSGLFFACQGQRCGP